MCNNIELSPHFELREFTESTTARKHGIVNEPTDEAVENLRALCVHTLEPLREALGLPIVITSGYRCRALDERIDYDQLILYPAFIHVSYVRNGKNRGQLTKASGNGKYQALSRAQALALL